MGSDRLAFLSQMVEVLTSTVSFAERLGNMVHLLARFLKMDQAFYFGILQAVLHFRPRYAYYLTEHK